MSSDEVSGPTPAQRELLATGDLIPFVGEFMPDAEKLQTTVAAFGAFYLANLRTQQVIKESIKAIASNGGDVKPDEHLYREVRAEANTYSTVLHRLGYGNFANEIATAHSAEVAERRTIDRTAF